MLTDIFATRYAAVPLWDAFGENERRLLVQAFRILSEQLFPFYGGNGAALPTMQTKWRSIHDRLTMELGLQQLSATGYWAQTTLAGNPHRYWQALSTNSVCESFVCAAYEVAIPADRFVKERLSFVEIAFRDREQIVAALNASLPQQIQQAERNQQANQLRQAIRLKGSAADAIRTGNARLNQGFRDAVEELNTRFRQAGANLHYHNGFIQVSEDAAIEQQVEAPFWKLLDDAKWRNVDTDMKEAIDRRDGGDRDPAFYAAKALESTIKIISNEKEWSTGNERGAGNYIDNLASARSGRFITGWEQDALKAFFSKVRNELGHGPGDEPMPELTPQQTSWAIETCMSWIKTLALRMTA